MMIIKKLFLFAITFFLFSACNQPVDKYHVFMAGDSTLANKSEDAYPETGWGQVLPEFFDTAMVEFENHARNGRSSKSFRSEGLWDDMLKNVVPGSYVFIQFGHNDESPSKGADRYSPIPEFKENLLGYVRDVREMEAFPVLLTSVVRRKFNERDDLVPTHGDYPEATIEVAREMNTTLIDHRALSAGLVCQKGDSLSKELYLWVDSGHPNYPEGEKDDTHFSEEGARAMAELVVNAIRDKGLPLANAIKE